MAINSGDNATNSGHSFYADPAINKASAAYISVVVVYTGILFYGLITLFRHRHKQPMRVRGYPIMAAAVLAIHFYVAALFIVYPLNADFKCGTEFWIMSTALPLGMALFQASNVRLMAYAEVQHQLAEMECFSEPRREAIPRTWNGIRTWFSRLSYVRKTYFWISVGLIVQLIVTFTLFFGSRRFNPEGGFFGEHVDRTSCRRGFEWIPSVIWQFLWTWVIGPLVLFKTRKIKDTHFWALQTRICVIAGLPGTPMWLCFLYISSPALDKINPWWPPAMWFAPGLITMCISSILLPAIDIYRRSSGKDRTKSADSSISQFSGRNRKSFSQSKEMAQSMGAFDFQLKHNSAPLLAFAATKDFTSENVLFLREVRDFKLKWRRHVAMSPSLDDCLSDAEMRTMYEDAARIYFELINPDTATISVNLDSHMYDEFASIFGHVSYEAPWVNSSSEAKRDQDGKATSEDPSNGSRNIIAPWNSPAGSNTTTAKVATTGSNESNESETAIIPIGLDSPGANDVCSSSSGAPLPPICGVLGISLEEFERIRGGQDAKGTKSGPSTSGKESVELPSFNLTPASGQPNPNRPKGKILSKPNGSHLTRGKYFVPNAFSLNVFDKAYNHIKYLVYHNTWKSYVNTLNDEGIQKLVMIYTCGGNYVPRRGPGADDNPISHMTDVELYDLNLELQAERDGTDRDQIHHGVLDTAAGPVPMVQVDARCSCCRNRSRVERIQNIIGLGPSHNFCAAK